MCVAALEVTKAGVSYESVQGSPQAGLATGDHVHIQDAVIWIDSEKFSADTRTDKKYLILKVKTSMYIKYKMKQYLLNFVENIFR